MKEVRLHGRGGQGLVTAAHILVEAVVKTGNHASFIPFFGVERKGSPVYGFLRLDDKPIRPKTQVYHPHCLMVLDDTLMNEVDIFEGIRDGATLVINSTKPLKDIKVPKEIATIGQVDAANIALRNFGRNIPNTTMLGAFCRATGWAPLEKVMAFVERKFGPENALACKEGYESASIVQARCRKDGF
jgi:2-oxoacid:acceptor oxidoreductase gamma subunit (pyruvate/2-ketoisovalerate family)